MRVFRPRAPQDQQFAEMLDRRAFESGADACRDRFALVPVVAGYAHLDELVRFQRNVDLVENRVGKPLMTDCDHRMQVMRTGAQVAALRR